jgi:hypothetical protein
MKYSIEELLGLWHNPPAEYRGKPFWSWNSKLEKHELIRQMHILKSVPNHWPHRPVSWEFSFLAAHVITVFIEMLQSATG